MTSILQPWVTELGLRHQGVLVSAIRGCDSVGKHDPSKALIRSLRAELLVCHCGDPAKAKSFIEAVDPQELQDRMTAVLKNFDHYPVHFIVHLMHASAIIGFNKPQLQWTGFYCKMCHKLHTHPESKRQIDERLNADEETFATNQQ